MFNDWGVHHLHLHDTDRARGTREILFVLVRSADVYFVDVGRHGRGHHPWVDDDIVEIIHENWPHELARFRLGGAQSAMTLTRDDRRNLRSKNINAAVTMADGTMYAGIGGGTVISGANARAIKWSDDRPAAEGDDRPAFDRHRVRSVIRPGEKSRRSNPRNAETLWGWSLLRDRLKVPQGVATPRKEASEKGPVSLRFPTTSHDVLFPRLFLQTYEDAEPAP